LSYNSTFGKTT